MTIADKIAREGGESVLLYKEGAFWIAYDQSAFVLSQHKELKASKKFIKTVSKEIVSVGFPPVTLAFFYSQLGRPAIEAEAFIEIKLDEPVDQSQFEDWKNALPLYAKVQSQDVLPVQGNNSETVVIRMLAEYPLANRTPMEALLFIQELKNRLVSHGNA